MHAVQTRRALCARLAGGRAAMFLRRHGAHPIYVDHVPRRIDESSCRDGAWRRAYRRLLHGNPRLCDPAGRQRFAAAGRDVFVPDWPGHGRSPMGPDFPKLGTAEVAASLLALLDEIGPAVLLVHSASGPMAWWMTEQRPDLVVAVVAIAPGPPANLLKDLPDDPAAILALRDDASAGHPVYAAEDKPVWFSAEFAAAYWANAPRFPKAAFEAYRRSIVPESARILNERFNIGGRGLEDP